MCLRKSMGEFVDKCELYLISSAQFGFNFAGETVTPQQTPREFELSPDSESDRQLVWDDLLSIDEISSILQQLPLNAPA